MLLFSFFFFTTYTTPKIFTKNICDYVPVSFVYKVVGSFREIENESQVQKVVLVWVGVQSLIRSDPIRSAPRSLAPLTCSAQYWLRSLALTCALMRSSLNSSINVMGTQIG